MPAKAVILAAGRGTRLCPLTPFIPKEMLPVDGLPAIHYVLKELVQAGISDVMIVLSDGKESIRDYLTSSVTAKGEEATRLADERARVLDSINVGFLKQKELLGTAHAVGLAASFMGKDPLLVVYPDDLLCKSRSSEVNAQPTRDLLEMSRQTGNSVVLATEIDGREAHKYGVLYMHAREDALSVTDIVEKPAEYHMEKAYVLIGRMVITPRVMANIPHHRFDDGEGIIPSLIEEAKIGRLSALVYRGERYDLGSHEGYRAILRKITAY